MDELFRDCPSNQTYRSKTIQNEILEICGEMITEILVGEVKQAKFFSVLADEATDCSNVEHMTVVLRFVDSLFKIREEFLGFVLCQKGLSGEALAQEISNFIKSIGLRMEDCRGEGVSNFFNDSPKRTPILKAKINEIIPTAKQQKLLNVCRTRWIARIDWLRIFRNCYVAILAALEAINKDRSNEPDVRQRAVGMRKAMKEFEFIVCLVLVERCLKCTKPLTLQLQSASLDAGKAREKVSLLYLTIDKLRADIDQTHDTFYQMAVNLAKEVKIDPNKRTIDRQVHQSSECSSRYYIRIS
ncbi:52 kDa repressor of the inhibitor of the kinase-like [Paramuricea clavata]|uniref:52 kDa repressor of the inhibitor of the kinase-like n=1 Tax=Paramuricea clavata TaxID=317549 RepID=A0A6S7HTM2_PARCT|nr:52 kDa repressor of the inhibitor of the kinase-like [Paramuricea clavata]